MKLWERFKRRRHGVPLEPKDEFPWQQYYVIKGRAFLWDTGEPFYVRGEPWFGGVRVTTEELMRAGMHLPASLKGRKWTYGEPYDSVAEISWDTFKTMRKLGD